MKTFVLVFSILISTQTFAAKFTGIKKMKSSAAQSFALMVESVVKDEATFGKASSIDMLSFSRKSSETDEKTIKQLSYVRGGANSDDNHDVFDNASIEVMVEYVLEAVSNIESDYETQFASARKTLAAGLKKVKADKNLKILGSGHADEDGSWQILYILDSKNSEILMVTIGYFGT
ncbi:MAG: hypothetical protein K2P81_09190 [Bacteriovoracaceae bacterium]|nr:hypothetical protein [Bacteriovoracaceae bacterium]